VVGFVLALAAAAPAETKRFEGFDADKVLATAAELQAPPVGSPAMEAIIPQAEQIIRRHLKDPDSARFEWPYQFTQSPKIGAWWTCARYNARNSFGGYGEPSWFNVVVKDGQITQLNTDEEAPWMRGSCLRAIKKGELKPT
jgi:hypothetical protein